MKVQVMDVTPAQAREWLAMNVGNRHMRPGVVERYTRDMEAGAWQANGEAIVLGEDRVLDGQHRLQACVNAGVAFRTVVVTGAETAAMATIDQGLSRTLADTLRWAGYADPNNLSSAATLSYAWDNGLLLGRRGLTATEVLAYLETAPELVECVKRASSLRKPPLRLRASIAASFYRKAVSAAGPDDANEFLDRLYDGEDLKGGDAILSLRRLLLNNAARTGRKLSQVHILALVVKAWNAWILGEPLEVLSWKRGGTSPEAFPLLLDGHGNPCSAAQ